MLIDSFYYLNIKIPHYSILRILKAKKKNHVLGCVTSDKSIWWMFDVTT